MTRRELRVQVAEIRAVAESTGSYAYRFMPGREGLVEVRVTEAGEALVTPVDARGVKSGKPRRVRAWSRA